MDQSSVSASSSAKKSTNTATLAFWVTTRSLPRNSGEYKFIADGIKLGTGFWQFPCAWGRANRHLNSVASPGLYSVQSGVPFMASAVSGVADLRVLQPRSSDIYRQFRFVDQRESPSKTPGRANPFGI